MTEQPTEQTAEATVEEAPRCAFPECTARPVPKDPNAPGRAPKYCSDPDHNAMSAYRAKRGKASATKAAPVEEPSDRVVTDSARTAGIVQGIVLQKVDELRAELARYIELLTTITDPDAAEAEVASVAAAADSQVAEWRKKATTANTEREAAVRQRDLARAETEEAQEAADRAIAELEQETARFEAETERIRAEAEERVERLQAEADQAVEKTKEEAAAAVKRAQDEAKQQVTAAKEEADKRVREAQDKAGKAEVAAKAEVEAMQKTVKAVQAEKEQAVTAAQGAATAAEGRAREAEALALQAERDAETRVAAEKERRTEQEKAHAAELGRAIERQGVLEGQVEKLNTAVNDTKDKMREVQTELALAQAEVKRLTTAGGK
ncbi:MULTISPECIES: hypothetical protein [unclassified Streptomyces]|uniref:hypothetical protein n=1 Tax=unclassified Streptomyces TaxID=2593676 RepID=UPI003822418C